VYLDILEVRLVDGGGGGKGRWNLARVG
jgi:hypothetical protein